jgi:hypothetical protein
LRRHEDDLSGIRARPSVSGIHGSFQKASASEANAKQRLFFAFRFDGLHKAGRAKLSHSVGKRPDAGQDELVSFSISSLEEVMHEEAPKFQRVFDAEQIPAP